MKLKQILAQRKLRKLAEKQNHNPVLPNLNSAKLIGVIWHPTQREEFNYLKNYFNKEQVIFRGFCVFEEGVNPQANSNTLTTADINWLGFPKPDKIIDFTSINFDLLINISLKQNLVLETITLLSEAKFKVGSSPDEKNYFDLNINIEENNDTMYLVEQQIFYLAQLNKNSSK
ncbi:MAG: hypothetical protein GQ525_03970 [Draconibacterium sp.]|nr:hypothetical protein [Draconibacterium sp.]